MDSAGRFAHDVKNLVDSATQPSEFVSDSHGNHNYADISIHNANAVFGNVYNHYHSYGSTASSSNKRKNVDETEHLGSKIPRGPSGFSIEQLINSLKFEGIWQRHETIVGAAPGTCQWILSDVSRGTTTGAEEDDTSEASMRAFGEWLASDEPYFWIRGSAGSGKSTLVQYIVRHTEKIRVKLAPWSGDEDVVFASYFFWRAGTFLQKSTSGMLRSLLVQLLESSQYDQDTISSLIHSQFTRIWTQDDLIELLQRLILSSPSKVCLFIDALDEFHGYDTQDQVDAHQAALQESVHSLLDILEDLWSLTNVKLCVASRPGNEFEMKFDRHATIDLQLANSQDIDAYVTARLARRMPAEHVKLFRNRLVKRSAGVFLWTKLAVDMLLDGYGDEEDLHSLSKRLDGLPIGLESMYAQMLGKASQRYGEDCEYLLTLHHFLKVLLFTEGRDILPESFRLWTHAGIDVVRSSPFFFLCWRAWQEGQHRKPSTMKTTGYLLHSERSVHKLLQSRCGGLLCIRSSPQSMKDRPTDEWSEEVSKRAIACRNFQGQIVDYVHRSVEEFLAKRKIFTRLDFKADGSHLVKWPEFWVSLGEGAKRSLELLDSQASADGLLLSDLNLGPLMTPSKHRLTLVLYHIAVNIQALLPSTANQFHEKFLDELGTMPLLMDELSMIHILEMPRQLVAQLRSRRISLAFSTFCAQVLKRPDYVLKKLSPTQPLRTYESLMVIYFYSVLTFTSVELQDFARDIFPKGPMVQRALDICEAARAVIEDLLQSIAPDLENVQLIKRMCQHHHTFLHRRSVLKPWHIEASMMLCGRLRMAALSQTFFSRPLHQWLDQLQVLHPSLKLDREAFFSGSGPSIPQISHPLSEFYKICHPPLASTGRGIIGLDLSMSRICSELTEAELNFLLLKDMDESMPSNDTEMRYQSLHLIAFCLARHSKKCNVTVSWLVFLQRLRSNLKDLRIRPPRRVYPAILHLRTQCQACTCRSCPAAHATDSLGDSKPEGRQVHADATQDKCSCPFAQRINMSRCPLNCPGCPCDGSVYTWVLRQYLQSDELDWENWFETLIYAYGYTKTEFETWEAAIHSEEVELRQKWKQLQSKT